MDTGRGGSGGRLWEVRQRPLRGASRARLVTPIRFLTACNHPRPTCTVSMCGSLASLPLRGYWGNPGAVHGRFSASAPPLLDDFFPDLHKCSPRSILAEQAAPAVELLSRRLTQGLALPGSPARRRADAYG